MLPDCRIGCGSITWQDADITTALADIARAGYDGAPLVDSCAPDAQGIQDLYTAYGLRIAPGYFSGAFWRPELVDHWLDQARRHAALARALGLTETYVSASGSPDPMPSGRTRRQAAGHVQPADSLPEADFRHMAAVVNRIGAIMLACGVRACFHNHVGTPVETEEEYERLIELLDPALVFLGPDTGHLYWGGTDPVRFAARHAERILTLHIKDVNPDIARAGHRQAWDYATTVRAGLWTELGQGCLDFPALLAGLEAHSFKGWIIVETDVTQLATPLASAMASRAYLRQLGI